MYIGVTGQIVFGSPANYVDLGEDHSIIIHELGHGLHHWISNNSLSQVDGLSEGLADYWAQSYTRSLGKYGPYDEAYDYLFVWGFQPQYNPYERVTNFGGHYPEALNGHVHHDGQLWASSLMSIYDLIGREATDRNCWEGISMLNTSSNQVDAAFAFIQADGDLYDGAHLEHIYTVFYERGYLPDLVFPAFTADQINGEGPRDVVFTDYSVSYSSSIVSWKWDFNNDGEIDSYDQNPTYTFTDVGSYTISLTVSDGETTEILVKKNYITVDGGFFVFETFENYQDYSGAFIRDFLEARGYDVVYSNYFPASLAAFDAVFLSFGNAGESTDEVPLFNYSQSMRIQEYLENGGRVYIEGFATLGGPIYYNWDNAAQLLNLFGVTSADIGSNNPITSLEGQSGTWAEGMLFNESNQQLNAFIDIITPESSAYIPFYEDNYGNISVYNEGEYGQKTFYFGYSLAELVDVDPHSSRYNILVKLLEFFGYPESDGYVVANFSADQSEVEPGLDVQYNDWSLVDEGYEITGWAWDFDEDGEFDSFDQNPVWTYSDGGIFDVKLVVYGDENIDTLVKKDFISVRSGFLVYEGNENENGYSGTFIRDYLEDHWYDEISYTNKFPVSLKGYDDVFLSFGSRGWRKTPLTDTMADAIIEYCSGGGRIYIEGGDAMESFSDKSLFGLLDVADGENNSIDGLIGQEEAITAGMHFDSTNQLSDRSIDIYTILENNPAAKIAFDENDYGSVAVQYDGTEGIGHKTFCLSYALADLVDGEGLNTRNELLKRILNFFDVPVGVEESEIVVNRNCLVFPNPARNHLALRLILDAGSNLKFELFDFSGRLVSTMNKTLPMGTHQLDFEITDLPPGIYYLRYQSDTYSETIKWVKVN